MYVHYSPLMAMLVVFCGPGREHAIQGGYAMTRIFRLTRILLLTLVAVASLSACVSSPTSSQATLTDVGTPRSQTLIFQNFDGKTNSPNVMNPLMGNYAIWRGFRELGWG